MTSEQISEILAAATVGIAGCGGLGSNCAAALARIGVGTIVMADFDVVDPSNINRQFYFYDQIGMKKVEALHQNLIRIAPEIKIHTFDIKLCPSDIVEIFGHCDVIVEAFDEASAKQMIIESVLMMLSDMPLVTGNGMAGWGRNNELRTEQFDNLYVCGDFTSAVSEELPPLAPRVGVVAHMQANQVLELLLEKYNK